MDNEEEVTFVQASAPIPDDEEPVIPVPDITARIAELTAGPVYESLHSDTYKARSPLQVEEFKRIETAVNPQPQDTRALQAFEAALVPYEDHLAPVQVHYNWLHSLVDSIRTKFKERPHRRFVALRTDKDVQQFFFQNSLGERREQPFNPQFLVDRESSRIAKLISYSAPAPVLKQAGLWNLTAKQLAEHGLVVQDLRNYRRPASELPELFDDLVRLEAAGFSRHNFDAVLWSLQDVAAAYYAPLLRVANHFTMTVRDLLAANVAPADLPALNVRMEHIMQDHQPFELLLALRMNPIELQQLFGLHPGHLLHPETQECLLSSLHFDFLHTYAGWNDENLRTVGFTDAQMRKMKVVPELSTDSIMKAIGIGRKK
jgi:hypothetical protein